MARDTGSYTASTPPVADPVQTLTATASNSTTAVAITYTTASAHNLSVGQPVITSGFSNAWLNYNPDSGTGAGTPAVVASVTSSTVFTVNMPAVVSTASSSVSGSVTQAALVSKSPYSKNWLPTTASTNVVVAREWGASFPIQPNDDRATNTALATTLPSGNGLQVTYTVASHSFVPGQVVSIQGVVPDVFNLENVTIAATTSTTIIVNSTINATATSLANGSIVAVNRLNGTFPAISSAIGATGVTGVTKTTTATTTATTSIVLNNNTGVVVGGVVTGTNVAANTVITAVTGTQTITISPATTGAVASAATLTFGSGLVNLYTTGQAHGLTAGQNVTVQGASVAPYNTSGVVQNATATTFSVKAPTFKINRVSGTSGTGTVGDGTNVVYYTDSAHGLAGGDTVNIGGFTPTGYNVVNGTVLTSPAPTSSSFAVANTTNTTITTSGYGLKNSGSFTGTARISVEDNGWGSTYLTPSGNLVPGLDNHERVTNSESGYPAYAPGTIVPNVVGLTMSNAIQKIRSAGLQPGSTSFSSDLSVTAVTTATSNVTYTTGTTAHNLGIGDTVNLSGGSVTTHNLGDVLVSAVSGFTFTVNQAGVTGTVGTGLVARPKNTVVSAQTPSAGSSIADGAAKAVALVRNYGL